jgi:hypothetical protein
VTPFPTVCTAIHFFGFPAYGFTAIGAVSTFALLAAVRNDVAGRDGINLFHYLVDIKELSLHALIISAV